MTSREIVASLDVIVRPDGWIIPDEGAAMHGITTEHAAAVGVPESLALSLFLELWGGRKRIAHNEQPGRPAQQNAPHVSPRRS
ncbi:hypothetical protein G6F63_016316 [Rhizopus arrhizus]|nr:hypothetical protein G6F63_016316 [Rhizopus arrhizus]KAG1374382.1 hypothetical protein G6F59_018412 [Rhizopus arrhizus]